MQEYIAQYPVWLQAWVLWMALMNLSAVGFVIHRVEARWVLGAFVAAGFTMEMLFQYNGFNRLLGLAHVIFWTPLLWYLWHRRRNWFGVGGVFSIWLTALFATDAISLVVDYIDAIRYALGDRGA